MIVAQNMPMKSSSSILLFVTCFTILYVDLNKCVGMSVCVCVTVVRTCLPRFT